MLKKMSSLWSSSVVGALLAFGLQAVFARSLTPIEFGHVVSALALCTALAPIATLGIAGFWPRVFGEEGNAAHRWVPPTIKYNLTATVAIYVGLLLWAIFGPHSPYQQILLAVTSLHLFGYVAYEIIITCLQVKGRYFLLSWWQILPHFLRLLFALFLALSVPTMAGSAASGVYALTALIGVVVLPFYLRDFLKAPKGTKAESREVISNPSVIETIRLAWPYSATSLLYLLYLQIPVILSAYAIDSKAAGHVGIVMSLLSASYLIPSSVYQKLFLKRIHELAKDTPTLLKTLIAKSVSWMFFLGLSISAIFILIADVLIHLVFGFEYAPASTLLKVAAIALPFRFMSLPFDALLSTKAYVYTKVRISTSIVATLIFLSIPLTFLYGTNGIVIALVASEVLNWLWLRNRAARLLLGR